jgi:hypothetical protein
MVASADLTVALGPAFWARRALGFVASVAAVTALLVLASH